MKSVFNDDLGALDWITRRDLLNLTRFGLEIEFKTIAFTTLAVKLREADSLARDVDQRRTHRAYEQLDVTFWNVAHELSIPCTAGQPLCVE